MPFVGLWGRESDIGFECIESANYSSRFNRNPSIDFVTCATLPVTYNFCKITVHSHLLVVGEDPTPHFQIECHTLPFECGSAVRNSSKPGQSLLFGKYHAPWRCFSSFGTTQSYSCVVGNCAFDTLVRHSQFYRRGQLAQ